MKFFYFLLDKIRLRFYIDECERNETEVYTYGYVDPMESDE